MIEMHWVIFVFALLVCGVIGWLVCRRIERGYRRAVEAENRVLREDHGRSGVSGEIPKGGGGVADVWEHCAESCGAAGGDGGGRVYAHLLRYARCRRRNVVSGGCRGQPRRISGGPVLPIHQETRSEVFGSSEGGKM